MKLAGTLLATLLVGTLASLAGCDRKLDEIWCNNHPGMCDGDGGVTGGVFKISVNVSGLTGMGLVLENNGGDDLPIAQNGKFTFATLVDSGAAYAITVATPPTMPAQTCDITNATGTADADVSNIQVTCQVQTFAIGGTVGGLNAGASVVLANGSDTVTVNAAGPFTFPMKVPSNTGYVVTVKTQPASGPPCSVYGGTGTVGNSDVTSVVVNCSSNLFAIGGSVVGLNGTVKLKNMSNNDVATISSNGTYAFSMLVSGAYNVVVSQQPGFPPAQQTCSVANGMGTATGNVTDINVSCTTSKYTIGGSISGLTGTVVLQDNLADDLTRTMNGNFTFATSIASGASYSVTVKTQPAMQLCSVAMGGGTVKTSNVTNVSVTCKYQDPGILCGANYCDPSNSVCCDPESVSMPAACTASNACFTFQLPCDSTADCTAAGSSGVCCANENGGHNHVTGVGCTTMCGGRQLCDPNAPGCPPMKSCQPYGLLPGYYACQ